MKKAELDILLHQWAAATAPDAQTLSRLQECVHADLRGATPLSVKSDPIPAAVVRSPWRWVWAQAACVGWLLGVDMYLWNTGLAQKPFPMAPAPVANSSKPACSTERLGGGSHEATCLQIARDLRFHMIFLEVSDLPGLAGPYRSDALARQAIPCREWQWLAMASQVWEVRKRNN